MIRRSDIVFILQVSEQARLKELRSGLAGAPSFVVLGLEQDKLWHLAGIDALYLSVTRSERWCRRPPQAHQVVINETSPAEQALGMPIYILSGLILNRDDQNSAMNTIPKIVNGIRTRVRETNTKVPGSIYTVGISDFELRFPGESPHEIGRLLAAS